MLEILTPASPRWNEFGAALLALKRDGQPWDEDCISEPVEWNCGCDGDGGASGVGDPLHFARRTLRSMGDVDVAGTIAFLDGRFGCDCHICEEMPPDVEEATDILALGHPRWREFINALTSLVIVRKEPETRRCECQSGDRYRYSRKAMQSIGGVNVVATIAASWKRSFEDAGWICDHEILDMDQNLAAAHCTTQLFERLGIKSPLGGPHGPNCD